VFLLLREHCNTAGSLRIRSMTEVAQNKCQLVNPSRRCDVTYNRHLRNLFLYKKVKTKVKFTLEQAMKAQRGSRGVEVQLYSFFNLGVRWGGWSTLCPGRFTPGKDPVPIV